MRKGIIKHIVVICICMVLSFAITLCYKKILYSDEIIFTHNTFVKMAVIATVLFICAEISFTLVGRAREDEKLRKLVLKHGTFLVGSFLAALLGTIGFKAFISGWKAVFIYTFIKLAILWTAVFFSVELVDLYVWVIKTYRPFSYLARFIWNNKLYSGICIVLAIFCFMPVMVDYVTDTKPYGYYTKEMVKVSGKEGCQANVGEITKGTEITQTFYCKFDTLTSITLNVATYARNNDCTLCVKMVNDDTGELYEEWELDALEFNDNSIITLECKDPIAHFNMKGKNCRLEITSSANSEEQAVTLYYSTLSLYDKGELLINGGETGGDLFMIISGYESVDSYERVQVWLCVYLLIVVEAVVYCLRRKIDGKRKTA